MGMDPIHAGGAAVAVFAIVGGSPPFQYDIRHILAAGTSIYHSLWDALRVDDVVRADWSAGLRRENLRRQPRSQEH